MSGDIMSSKLTCPELNARRPQELSPLDTAYHKISPFHSVWLTFPDLVF